MNPTDFLSGSAADALGWTLLHALWQGFALVLPTAVVLHLLQNRSSALRYQISVLTLTAQLLLSAATFVWYYKPTVSLVNTAVRSTVVQSLPVRWQTIAQTLPWHQQVQQFLEIHLGQFVLIYLIGVVLFGLRLAGGWVYLQRLSRTATQSSTQKWTELTDALRSAMAIRAVVQVRESARIMVPMVAGILKPVLLLPIGLVANLSVREVEAVLAHELAHIKRHDYAVNLLQSVMEVLYFFHPALWWLSARVREEREHCCDDLAVQAIGGDGRILAQALARVEELRLTQTMQSPALAMAFATKRQQLLHRVRRVLGIQTRPFVSNSSLVGLTLATVLLVSVSVYAVQQDKQPKPKSKPRTTQPQATRRHKVDGNSEYGMAGDRKVSYVIWKGQKLPATRVAQLQRQLDQVMAGQLSLDAVKQPDRDILLTIIEKNNAFDDGMDGLAAGLAHLDYNNIIKTGLDAANAAGTFPVNVDSMLKEVEKINYNSLIGDAMATVSNLNTSSDSLDKQRAYHQRQMDSLSQLIAQRSQQMQSIQLQMEKFRFPMEEITRNSEVLQWKKDKLMEQRDALIEKHQRLLHNDGKQKLSQADVEKQLAALEPEIKKLEGNMEELNKQFETVNTKQDEFKQPMDKLKREAEQLEEQIGELSDEIGRHSDGLVGFMNLNHELNLNLNKELNVNLNRELSSQKRQIDRQLREMKLNLNSLHESARKVNRTTPVRPPRPPKPANAIRPAIPAIPPAPVVAPTPKPSVAPTPKVAPAPKP
ncbi:M56 family metallopeptidase [Spirosoma arcticum]